MFHAFSPELPRLIRLKYLTTVNRWTELGGVGVGLLQEATQGDPSRSLVWRDLLSKYGVGDVASFVFNDHFGCWGFLDLWRTGSTARFSAAEAAYLAGIREPVTEALRRCQGATFVGRALHQPERVGPLVLLLSPDLRSLRQTPETEEVLRTLVPPPQGRAPIPAGAYNVAAQLLAQEANIDPNPPVARVHVSDGLWVTLRAARIGDPRSTEDAEIAVTVEESSPAERVSVFARAFGLTPRERELLAHLVTGADTREVARRMFLSAHTVQDHLKSIFAKTDTHNRRTLLSRAVGS